MLDPTLDTPIDAGENDLDCVGIDAGVAEDPGQRRPLPFRRPDRLDEPGLAERPWAEPRAPVAGAFERDRDRPLWPRPNVCEGQLRRPRDPAPDREPPSRGIDCWDVAMN